MQPKIRALSEQTINQIAAGEVIENPASVVKELIENAIDAGSTRIEVEIMGGGHQLIRVADNGSGMGKEDAFLCLERHATSKIEKADDLIVLGTMGFRGEALASIASVSKMSLLTAEEDSMGTQVDVEGGKVVHVGPAPRSRGTTMEVRSLFYNVPARKKFQKSLGASVAEVTKIVTQQALSHPNVGFDLIVQDQPVFSVQETTHGELVDWIHGRSLHLLGGHFETDVFKMDVKQGYCGLKGVIGSPLAHRHNRSGQYLFVNRRPVVCPLISYAIRDAYGTRLPSDRHPIFSLHLEIPSHVVDVNVHPQKKEIRLRDEKGLREAIQTAVNLALQRAETPVRMNQMAPLEEPFCFLGNAVFEETAEELPPSLFREEMQPISQEISLPLPSPVFQTVGLFSHYLLVDPDPLFKRGGDELPLFPLIAPFREQQGGVIVVDLHAAHARILFETLLKQAAQAPASQGLLIPGVLSVSLEEEVLIHTYEEELAQIGFEVRQCGKNKFLVESVPPFIEAAEAIEALKEILVELQEGMQRNAGSDEKLRQLAQAACRFARGRKRLFMLQEAEGIFKQLIQTSSPTFCPSGNLTLIYMGQHEIEKKFSGTTR